MKATKTFVRNGRRYKPGDSINDELDTETVNHYKRLGMVDSGEPGKVIAGTAARLVPNTPQRVSTKPRNATGVKIPGTPESSLEVKTAGAGLPAPNETQQPKPGEQPQTGPDEKPQTGPTETGLPPGPQDTAAPPASLPLGPVDATA